MIEFDKAAVRLEPYPHLISDQIVEPRLFASLQSEFPDDEVFASNRKQGFSAGRASRINLGRGDAPFDEFMARSAVWRAFFTEVNSDSFVARVVALFADQLEVLGSRIQQESWRFDPRPAPSPGAFAQRVLRRLHMVQALDRVRAAFRPNRLCIDFDIAWARNGYATEAHTDNRNKFAAMLIYFGETSGTGGDFQVLKLKQDKPLGECMRYPKSEELQVVQALHPKPNRGAIFLNCNRAYHDVTPLSGSDRPRQFLYVSISSRYSYPIW